MEAEVYDVHASLADVEQPHDLVHTARSAATLQQENESLPTSSEPPPVSEGDHVKFEPLRSHWKYGQAVFARYKRTPYFYSGNIATYLGGGLFMVVFDDGTLDYRVKREDIILRDTKHTAAIVHEEEEEAHQRFEVAPRRASRELSDVHRSSSLTGLSQRQQMMVDFSVSPPRQVMINELQSSIQDDALEMKRLDCGIAYEDDSTQVSDSDSSSEEDVNMTPWQQMTQTFGMGKGRAKPTRRSSISSLSQMERLSMTHKQILPSPKGIKQTISDYLLRKNKKVQPSTVGANLALMEQIRIMEERQNSLREKCTAPGKEAPSSRVIYERKDAGGRAYGTIKAHLPSGEYEVVTEEDQTLMIKIFAPHELEIFPSLKDLEEQIEDLAKQSKQLYAGRKIQVNLYPGSRFSGPGMITVEKENPTIYHVLLQNRIRLMNVPADKISPLKERKRDSVYITDDHVLICSNKQKVSIGEQVFVKCEAEYDGTMEEKLGTLNGVYSNRTAAIDFADGSTGYQIPAQLISKRKRAASSAELDVMSLKNAVLMQAASTGQYMIDVGYQVKADHPRKQSVERCVVIKKHSTSSFDLRFPDGTIALEVFPSQMIIDNVETDPVGKAPTFAEAAVGDYVLGWSSRFGRYCSAKVATKENDGVAALYTLVFDYGEQKMNVPAEKIALLHDMDVLSATQKLTNYSIDTIGFELSPVSFAVGEAVMAQVHGSIKYFYGRVEAVNEKERRCVVVFDSSERDENVRFSAMFSVDARHRCTSFSNKKSSSSGVGDRMHFHEDAMRLEASVASRRRRHSGGSVGSLIMSVAGSIFRARKEVERRERRGSHNATEAGKSIEAVVESPNS